MRIAFVVSALFFATTACGQRVLGPKRACNELPAVLKRANDTCWVICARQTEAKEQLPGLIAQCNAEARAGPFEKAGCVAVQDYIRRVLKMEVPEGLTCR